MLSDGAAESVGSDKIDKAMSAIFYAMALLFPLIWANGLQDFAMRPKRIMVDVAAWLLVALFIMKQMRGANVAFVKSFLFIPIALLLCAILVSFSVSINYAVSIDEFLRYLSLAALFFVAVHHVKTSTQIERMFDLLLASGIVAVAIGVFQYYEVGFTWIWQTEPPGITFAHENMAAEYLALLIPIALYRMFRHASVWKIYCYASVASLFLLFSLFVRARGTWIGITLSLIVGMILWRTRARSLFGNRESESKSLQRHRSMALLVGILMSLLISQYAGSSLYGKSTLLESVESIAKTSEGTTPFRMEVWRSSWGMIKNNPLLGVGAGNWKIYFPRYLWIWDKEKAEEHFGERDTFFGAGGSAEFAHNDYLHLIAELGVVAILFFALLIYGIFRIAIDVCRNDKAGEMSLCVIATTMSLVLFGCISCFSFPLGLPSHSALFFLMLATLVVVKKIHDNGSATGDAVECLGDHRPNAKLAAAFVSSMVILILIGFYHGRLLMADVHGMAAVSARTDRETIARYEESIGWYPYDYNIYFYFGLYRQRLGDEYGKALSGLEADVSGARNEVLRMRLESQMATEYEEAEKRYRDCLALNPYHISSMYNMAIIEQNHAVRYRDKEHMAIALGILSHILDILPDHPLALKNMTLMACQLGSWDIAEKCVNQLLNIHNLPMKDRIFGEELKKKIKSRGK